MDRQELEIKATIYFDKMKVHLEPDFAVLRHPQEGESHAGGQVTWSFIDLPSEYEPKIDVVSFTPRLECRLDRSNGNLILGINSVFLRPFKSQEVVGDKLTAVPYKTTAGTCNYEVVLVPRKRRAKNREVRLYCTTRYMGGLDVDPPP